MNKIIFIIVIVYSAFFFCEAKADSTEVLYGVCPFECCQYGDWIIKDTIKAYQNVGDTSTVSFMLTNNDTILAVTGNLHFLQIGKVLVLKPIYGFQPNDTLLAYNCDEQEYLVSHNGVKSYVEIFWPMFFYEYEDTEENYLYEISKYEYFGKMIQRPKAVWWVKIKFVKVIGWIKLKNRMPYCFSIDERIEATSGCG